MKSIAHGQDGQHPGIAPAYRDNGDGTISDLNTGLMWVKDRGKKATWDEAISGASACRMGGYSDWRMPTIKELYSLINFNGGSHPGDHSTPYIDTRYFGFQYGDIFPGERPIDCQDWSASQCVGTEDLPPIKSKAPTFMVWAVKDPTSGNLDRIQIMKGWTKNGQSFEKIYDVVWAGDRKADKWTGIIPPIQSTVDIDNATYTNNVGSVEVKTVWTDPEFDPSLHAFYYARVLEIPTPRRTTTQAHKLASLLPTWCLPRCRSAPGLRPSGTRLALSHGKMLRRV